MVFRKTAFEDLFIDRVLQRGEPRLVLSKPDAKNWWVGSVVALG